MEKKRRKSEGLRLFTFCILHYNGGVLEERDEKVARLQVGIERQLWVVHHCGNINQHQSYTTTALKIPTSE